MKKYKPRIPPIEGRLYFGWGFLAFEKTKTTTTILVPQIQTLPKGEQRLHAQHEKPLRIEVMPRVLGSFQPKDLVNRLVVANNDQLVAACPISMFMPSAYMRSEHMYLKAGEGVDLHFTLEKKMPALFYLKAWEIEE